MALTTQQQASSYYARRRTRGFRTVVGELAKTHDFARGATSIDTGDSFGDAASRTRPITFRFQIRREDTTASGTILRFGSAARRTIVTILANTGVRVVAGSSGDDQVTVDATSVLLNRTLSSDTAQAGAPTTITLAATEPATDDFYNADLVVLTGGTGSGQSRVITDYDGGTKIATVAAWATDPDVTTTYDVRRILPTDIAIAVEPNRGRVTIWREGQFAAAGTSVNGDFNGAWCDDDVTGLYASALTDATVGTLNAYAGQTPLRRRI